MRLYLQNFGTYNNKSVLLSLYYQSYKEKATVIHSAKLTVTLEELKVVLQHELSETSSNYTSVLWTPDDVILHERRPA